MSRPIDLPRRIGAGVMVGLAIMLVWWLPAVVLAAERSGLARGPVIDISVPENQSVVVKSYYATIRSKPSDDAELIGYVPGALRLLVAQPQREVGGWLRVGVPFWWSTSDEMWVRRKDVAFASEFRRMEGQRWPLRYNALYYAMIHKVDLQYYPPDNRCPEKLSAASTAGLLKDAGIKKRYGDSTISVVCSEIWYVPNTKLIFAGSSAGWYDPTTGDIFFLSGIANHAVYGHRDGRVLEFIPEACANGEEIACGIVHRDPLKTIPPHPPASPYRAHPAARPHPPGSYRESPDARPHPPGSYRE